MKMMNVSRLLAIFLMLNAICLVGLAQKPAKWVAPDKYKTMKNPVLTSPQAKTFLQNIANHAMARMVWVTDQRQQHSALPAVISRQRSSSHRPTVRSSTSSRQEEIKCLLSVKRFPKTANAGLL